MKKLSILLIGLLLVAGFASAQVTLTLAGTSTLTWGLQGSLIDNSANFGDVNTDFGTYTGDTGQHNFRPNRVTLTMEVADEDGMVIVTAESRFDIMTETPGGVSTADNAYQDAFQFIEFPNVVPGMLGIRLNKNDPVSTAVTAQTSVTTAPHVLVTTTPVDGLTAKVGFVFVQEGLDRVGVTPADTVIYDTYIAFGTSIFAEYKLMLGEEDNVTVAFGTVFDTQWTNHVYTVDPVGNITDDVWGPKVVVAQTAAFDWATAEAALETNEVLGLVSAPIGLKVGAEMAGLTAGVHFQTRLVQGADELNLNADGLVRAEYELPMYVGVDVAYEMDMAGMTIKPNANFKYSSDFWKWDPADFSYEGNVSPAAFAGRPMSAGLGVGVTGIADGLLDVSLSGSAGFGDGEYNHGGLGPGLPYGGAFTLTQFLEDFAEANGPEPTAGVNDGWFAATTPLVWRASLGLTANPTDEIKVTNTTSYTVDNLGVVGRDGVNLWGTYLNRLDNNTRGEYALMVGDATAATFFAALNFRRDGYVTQMGEALDTDTGTMTDTEQAFKNTLGYQIGVQVTVSTP